MADYRSHPRNDKPRSGVSAPVDGYVLLDAFRALFEGHRYNHRNSTLGDNVAGRLYEDLVALGKSKLIAERVRRHECVVNKGNQAVGKKSRRGDGTFGELVPTAVAITEKGVTVARGPVANIQIGAETKVLAKAMIKQIDRVISDLQRQVEHFQNTGGNPICVGIVGVNHAPVYTSYEGDRPFLTDGTSRYRHPIQEAEEAERRILHAAAPAYFDFQILRFRASNVPSFRFEWISLEKTRQEYSALLVRVSREYDKRFP